MIAVEYLRDLRKASSDPRLAGLLAAAQAPFDRAEWWEGLTAECGLQPVYAIAQGAEGVALLPLARNGATVSGLANWYTFRWRPLVSPGADGYRLLRAIGLDLRRSAWRLTFSQVPGEDGSAPLIASALRSAGWNVSCDVHDSNHILPLNGRNYAEFLASRPGPLRTTLKRKSGKVACVVGSRFDDDIWQGYQSIYAASWKPAEGSPAFLERFARQESAAGRLRLGLAKVDGKPVAAQFWTVEGGTAFIHKLAHREDAKAHSPGSVLSAALFEQVIDTDRVSLVDFGTGDDAYKRDWMDDIRPRYHIDALNPRDPRGLMRIARRALAGIRP